MDTSSTNKRTREEAEGKKVNVMKASEEPPAKAINTNARETQPSTSSSVPEGERDKRQVDEASKDQHEPVKGVDTAPTRRDTPQEVQPPVSVIESGEKCMVSSHGEGSPMAGKRPHESTVDSESQRDDGGGGEPPTKTPGVRSDLKASGECQPSGRKDESQDKKGQDVPGAEASMVRPKAVATKGEAPRSSSGVDATEEPVEGMDLTGASSKRPRDPSEGGDGREGDDGSCEGPPPKATLLRRATLKPKLNIPPDKRNSPLAAPP
ncbi:hypothetical protein HPB52_006224 [Rhipicephalus sanguineus]|uniref:Uncharacterized protein n=1 Tax=Rhipicephalus sanguineus TaxID=34632 RepID=A0A9D4PM97_RHISA|nr:hypothetical protein HPB52_006224 [Rhipicephalus sanguineus]